MATARIICIGNPYVPRDRVGPEVFRALAGHCDPDVEVVDGGLLGLDLLRLFDDVERIVFADTLDHADEGITVLADPQPDAAMIRFGHDGGLAVLLGAAPCVIERLPQIWLAGAGPAASPVLISKLAQVCLDLAQGKLPSEQRAWAS